MRQSGGQKSIKLIKTNGSSKNNIPMSKKVVQAINNLNREIELWVLAELTTCKA